MRASEELRRYGSGAGGHDRRLSGKPRMPRRMLKSRKRVGISRLGPALATLALVSVIGSASAQGFEFLGKGIEFSGGTVRLNEVHKLGNVKNDSTPARPFRLNRLGNFLMIVTSDAQDCRVNGVPTPAGLVWSVKGPHVSQIKCDTMRVDGREIER